MQKPSDTPFKISLVACGLKCVCVAVVVHIAALPPSEFKKGAFSLLPDPHPALRATFPGGEGFGAVRGRPGMAMLSACAAWAVEDASPYGGRRVRCGGVGD